MALPGHVARSRQIRHHRSRHSRPVHRLEPGREAGSPGQGRRQGHPGRRQERDRGRRQRNRLRRGAQQLLPAGHARADGAQRRGLGKRPQGLQLPSGGLHADQPGGHARGRRLDLRAAAEDRLRVELHRGREGLDGLHEDDLPRLAGPRHHLRPAREEGRLRQQHGLHLRPRQEGRGPGRAHRHRRGGHGIPHRPQLDRRHRGGDQQGAHRMRAGHRRRRPLGAAHLEHAGAA